MNAPPSSNIGLWPGNIKLLHISHLYTDEQKGKNSGVIRFARQ